MWFDGSVPKAPRGTVWGSIEKVVKIGGIVVVPDSCGGWLRRSSVKRFASHLPRLAIDVNRDSRPPTLGSVSHVPTMAAQDFGPTPKLTWKIAKVVRGFL
jgi:hypothetical protein